MEHLHAAERLAAGIHALPGITSSFASTQAAWRFFQNPRTTPSVLVSPLREAACRHCPEGTTALVVHDWSCLNYGGHAGKKDLLQITHKKDRGYFLSTALLVEGSAGMPIAPLEMSLKTAEGSESTRTSVCPADISRLDALEETMEAAERLLANRTLVHVIDREADSVGHYRQWDSHGHHFLVRADHVRRVSWEGRSLLLRDIARMLSFHPSPPVEHKGASTARDIAETVVLLDRPAKPTPKTRKRRGKIAPDVPIALRLIISRLRNRNGEVIAEWSLLTNLPPSIPALQITTWYAFRWRIEDVFRLLKSSGQQVEQWQQETGLSILKRLLIASMACVLAWRIGREQGAQAAALRTALCRLSGRQLRRGKDYTVPSLFAGLQVLLPFLALLEAQGWEGVLSLTTTARSLLRPLRESG